ncbi:Uncharacterised protein [Mycobacteroides abscessus subsp. abscessus]|nr:Uncharacterised protein [Mycobacteroides abscessus subsp. abscessus]
MFSSCNSTRSRSEYGSISRRPNPPSAKMANPLESVMPTSAAFVVSHSSLRSVIASLIAAAFSRPLSPSSCALAATRSVAAPM